MQNHAKAPLLIAGMFLLLLGGLLALPLLVAGDCRAVR